MFENREGRWSLSGHNFDKLRQRVRAYALSLCRRYGEPDDTAEEITQRTFEKYFSKRRHVDATKDPFPLLCKIAHDAWVDYCRQRAHETPQGMALRDEHTHQSQDPTPQQHALEAETSRAFEKALKELTPTNRTIAFYYVRLGLPLHRIGEIVSLTTSAVESRWRRTIQPHLKRHFRNGTFSWLAFSGALTGWLHRLRDAFMTPAGSGAMAAAIFVLPIPLLPGPEPTPPPVEQIINPDLNRRTPAAAPARPDRDTPDQRSTSPEVGPPPTYRQPPPMNTPAVDGEDKAPVRTDHLFELDPDTSDSGRKEADSNKIYTPYGTVTVGGDARSTGPIAKPPCVAGPGTCLETSHTGPND